MLFNFLIAQFAEIKVHRNEIFPAMFGNVLNDLYQAEEMNILRLEAIASFGKKSTIRKFEDFLSSAKKNGFPFFLWVF